MRNEALLPVINYIISHIALYFTPLPLKNNTLHKFANFLKINEANEKPGRNVPHFHLSHPETDMTQASQRVRF